MKTRLFAALFILLGCNLFATPAEDYARDQGRGIATETFVSKVIKDLSFKDGGVIYVAYLVRWQDRDVVIVDDHEFKKHYAVGDDIPCERTHHGTLRDGPRKGQARFRLAPESTIRYLASVQSRVAATKSGPAAIAYVPRPLPPDDYLTALADQTGAQTEAYNRAVEQAERAKFHYVPESNYQKFVETNHAKFEAERANRPLAQAASTPMPPAPQTPPNYTRESEVLSDVFTATVTQNLSFKDGDSEYVAYLVKWWDHEVLVTDFLPVRQYYAVGDSIRCRVMQTYAISPTGKTQRQLEFKLAPKISREQLAHEQAIYAEFSLRYAKAKQADLANRQARQDPRNAALPTP